MQIVYCDGCNSRIDNIDDSVMSGTNVYCSNCATAKNIQRNKTASRSSITPGVARSTPRSAARPPQRPKTGALRPVANAPVAGAPRASGLSSPVRPKTPNASRFTMPPVNVGSGIRARAPGASSLNKPTNPSPPKKQAASMTPLLIGIAVGLAILIGLLWVVTRNDQNARKEPSKIVVEPLKDDAKSTKDQNSKK